MENYGEKFPDEYKELCRRIEGNLPENWAAEFPKYEIGDKSADQSTRKLSQLCIGKMAKTLPEYIGGSADLNPSTFTYLDVSCDFQKASYHGRNLRFGVREHAMAAVCNGIAAYGGLIPFCSTFLNFVGYCLGAVTLSAVSHLRVIYIMTHDSVALGEDGPTHQPVEKYALCRATPNLLFLRPCDGNEVAGSYIAAIENKDGPTLLALTRQNIKGLNGTSKEGVKKGAYVISDASDKKPNLILVASGSEVMLCTGAKEQLEKEGMKIRVVSMPSWGLFDRQDKEYKEEVFVEGVPVMSVEAGVTTGWEKYAHVSVGINRFGLSGPYDKVFNALGMTVENVVAKAKIAREFYDKNPVPGLFRKPWNSSL